MKYLGKEFHDVIPEYELIRKKPEHAGVFGSKYSHLMRELTCRLTALTWCCRFGVRGSSTGRGAFGLPLSPGLLESAPFFPARWRTYIATCHQVINLRCVDSLIFHESIFHRMQNIHIVGQKLTRTIISYAQSVLSLLVDDACHFIGHMFRFRCASTENTSPSSSAYSSGPNFSEAHWVTMLRARLVITFNIVGRTGRNMFRPIDDLFCQTTTIAKSGFPVSDGWR